MMTAFCCPTESLKSSNELSLSIAARNVFDDRWLTREVKIAGSGNTPFVNVDQFFDHISHIASSVPGIAGDVSRQLSLNPKFYEVSEPELLRLGWGV